MAGFRRVCYAWVSVLMGVLGVAALAAMPAVAQPKDASNSGELRCNISGGGSFIVMSKRALDCVYTPDQGRAEHYTGHVKQFGLDIGPVTKGKLLWVVIAPGSGKKGPGRLAGTYVGYGGQVAVGKGGGYQNMLGGPNFNLIPTGLTGVTGVNLAVGVKSMKLVYVGR